MDKIKGSLETLSSLQITADMEGMDAQSKLLLHSREMLAVILQEVIEEYGGYSRREIMDFIRPDSLTDQKEVSAGRSNTQIRGENTEFIHLNEKTTLFDLVFRAKNPRLSKENMQVNLHIDLEPQKTYRPGYSVETRGIYYLARRLSAQLSLATAQTDYKTLEKCYSIWICRDEVPGPAQYSVSFYEMTNTKNTGPQSAGKEAYDLMTLVVIKLGDEVYNGDTKDEGYDLFRFLNAIMYPHKENFMDIISEYIDFSGNEELWKEAEHMSGLGQSIYEEGMEKGMEKGIEKGIQILIQGYIEEKIPRERILQKLQCSFDLTEEAALRYYEKFAGKNSF